MCVRGAAAPVPYGTHSSAHGARDRVAWHQAFMQARTLAATLVHTSQRPASRCTGRAQAAPQGQQIDLT